MHDIIKWILFNQMLIDNELIDELKKDVQVWIRGFHANTYNCGIYSANGAINDHQNPERNTNNWNQNKRENK